MFKTISESIKIYIGKSYMIKTALQLEETSVVGLFFVRCKSVPTHDEDFKVNIRVYLYVLKKKWNNKCEIKT